jgi:hypothetical protein
MDKSYLIIQYYLDLIIALLLRISGVDVVLATLNRCRRCHGTQSSCVSLSLLLFDLALERSRGCAQP